MGEEKESPTTTFPFANVLPAWSQPQPNSELGSRLAAARSFALPQICPTVLEENFPTAACRHLPWRHAHAAITQQGFCLDALNIAWPAGTYPVSMYLTRQKEYGHVHGNAQPIITLLEIYDISTL
jgi:hypothetical protein